MQNKIFTDQSTAFDHMNVDRRMYLMDDKESQTLKMKRLIMTTVIDVILIFLILGTSFIIM